MTGYKISEKSSKRLWSLVLSVCMRWSCYAKNRGYRAPKPGLSCPKFFLTLPDLSFLQWFR